MLAMSRTSGWASGDSLWLHCADKVLGGFRRGEFVGVLGTNGSLMTTLCRTFIYSALLKGFIRLHL